MPARISGGTTGKFPYLPPSHERHPSEGWGFPVSWRVASSREDPSLRWGDAFGWCYFASTTGSHTALGLAPPRSIVTVAFLYASLGAVKMFGT